MMLLPLEQVADRLAVSVRTVRRLLAARKLAPTRYTERGKIFVSDEEVERFLQESTAKLRPPKQARSPIGNSAREIVPRNEWGKC